jgi:tetratricopeptide (TPR) repeat protein
VEIVNWTNPVVILSLLFHLGITGYAIYGLIKKRDVVSYSIWFYLLPLSIVSNLFFPIGAFMGERFVFISSIGFCLFIGWLIYNYLPKITKNEKSSTYLTGFVLVTILCLYLAKTIDRNKAWKDNFTLFTTDLKTSENSAKGNYFAGKELLKKAVFPNNEDEIQRMNEFYEEAAPYLHRAVELHPEYADAFEALGNLYFSHDKDISKSAHYYAKLLETPNVPRSQDMYNFTRIILKQISLFLDENRVNPDEIIQLSDELLKIRPDLWEAYYIKGVVGMRLNDIELSLINFEKAESIDFPKTIDFFNNAGYIFAISGNYEKAVQHLLKAVEMGSNDYSTYINLGMAYQRLGDTNNANLYMTKGNEMKANQQKQ